MSTLHPPSPPKFHAEPDVTTGLKWSIILHGALFLFVVVKLIVFPGQPVTYVPSLRVDLVGLPDILKKDMHDITKPKSATEIMEALKTAGIPVKTAKKAPPVEPAQPDEMVLKPKPSPQEASKKAEKERAKKIKNSLARLKALQEISDEIPSPKAKIIKGNQVSPGSSLSGEAKENALSNYYDSLRERLQENWALPVWISRQNYSAQVQLFIDTRGRLHGFRFVKSSGNAQFDDAVKKTLTQSQPFPVPPGDLASSILMDGVLVGFPL